jgi:hypothetical protein
VSLPQPDVMPPELGAFVLRARDHPAGSYAMRLFAERR